MGDKILTQAEIEAMLASMNFDDEAPDPSSQDSSQPERPVKVYDFRRPDKFSKEHLRALRILHGSFARLLGSSLTSYLRASLQMRLTMVEQVTYEEYIRSLPSPTVLYVVSLNPLVGQCVVELNLAVARGVLDRLLGGVGLHNTRSRDMTEIEVALLKTLGNFLVKSLRDAWIDVVPLEPTIQEPALSPEFVQITLPGETTVMLVFEISMLKTTGTLSICIPHPVLQPVMDKITSQVWFTGSRHASEENSVLNSREQLQEVFLPLMVQLGEAELTVRDLMNLSVGQVIKLNTSADGSVPIRVGEHVKFGGRPGLVGSSLAVQITSKLAED